MRSFCRVVLAAAGAACALAQEPLNPPAPLAPSPPRSPAAPLQLRGAAQRAQDVGLPSVAAALYRQWLDTAPAGERREAALALATALLDAGEVAEAGQALAKVPEPHDAAWLLRAGLIALAQHQRDAAQSAWDRLKFDDLSASDLPWYYFLTGALWDSAPSRDQSKANQFYLQAEAAAGAVSDLLQARFKLTEDIFRLRWIGAPKPEELAAFRQSYEANRGTTIGYGFARAYASGLALSGRSAEAAAFLQQVLAQVPAQQNRERDEFEFLLGLVGDRSRTGAGRSALNQLLESGTDPQRQRQALELLALDSRTEPARSAFRAELKKLVDQRPRPAIQDALLLYQAQLAFAEKDFPAAEAAATRLTKDFPASPLRVHAFGVLTQSAWEQGRYRLAADYAHKAREALPADAAGRARAELGVVEAEAQFRATDYRQAADSYAAVLRDSRAELEARKVSELMFQCVVAEIRSGSGDAAKILDRFEADAAFDLENRWRAEWSLARALQVQGRIDDAFGRVTRLLTTVDTSGLKPELRARMAWLQARLAFDGGHYDQALALAGKLLDALGDVSEPLHAEIASTTILLKARAEFGRGNEAAALDTLKGLRGDGRYRKTDAAIYSYLIEASYYQAQGKIVEAQRTLTALADNADYQSSQYVPLALFQLALLSEQLGQESNLREANQRIEDLVKNPVAAADPDLMFDARMKQGDIFRKRNDFNAARQAYEDVINKYSQRPDVVYAELALAECDDALSSDDRSGQTHADLAQLKFEELRDRVNAPRDVRVEAGYNLGYLLQRRGKLDQAATVWMRDVIQPFLLDDPQAFARDATSPYWLGRTLLDLGELLEKQGKIEEAKNAYRLLVRTKLGYGEGLAAEALQRLGAPLVQL